jgi:hypothetical protein
MDVERTELGMLRNVQPEIVVAGRPGALGEEADTHAHRRSSVGIQQRIAIDAVAVEERDGIVAQRRETRDQRAQRPHG